jgi:small redox-active disulfide protein 2
MSNNIESIQVLGTGCPTCKKLFETTREIVSELGIKVEVEYITDIEKMMALGVMSSPVLAINGQAVVAGQLPSAEKIRELLMSERWSAAEKPAGGCSCGGKC